MKICLLGVEGNSYTKNMCIEFDKRKIEYDLLLVRRKRKSFLVKILLIPYNLYLMSTRGRFKALSKTRPYFWLEFIKTLVKIKFSNSYEFEKKYNTIDFNEAIRNAGNVSYTDSINHVDSYKVLKLSGYELGVFAGVGIVSEYIIGSFSHYCLNAHPAPLPLCKGGGALENTLNLGLPPSVSIHKAIKEIDGGAIFSVTKLELVKSDTFESVYKKLSILCCISMAKAVRQILDEESIMWSENVGTLYYWNECSEQIQKNVRYVLKKKLSEL
jgi:folate-dependent phosphoribosylglycinamide formyltransferase PurN